MLKYSIKELRARKNWTQAECAAKVGTSPQSWNAWEQDFSKVRLRDAVKVANLFGVTLDEIKIFTD